MSSIGLRKRVERATNRGKIINLLFEKSYRFNALFEASGFSSKSTLNSHLTDLQKEGVIERAFENNKPIYRLSLDPNVLTSEVKNNLFDNFINHFNERIPGLKLVVDAFLLTGARIKIEQRLREINGRPDVTDGEFRKLFTTYYDQSLADLKPDYRESELMPIIDFINKILDIPTVTLEDSS